MTLYHEDHDEERMGDRFRTGNGEDIYLLRMSDRRLEELSSLSPAAAAVALRDFLGPFGHPDCDCERCTEDRTLF